MNKGLTSWEWKLYSDSLTKANVMQLNHMLRYLNDEIVKRKDVMLSYDTLMGFDFMI